MPLASATNSDADALPKRNPAPPPGSDPFDAASLRSDGTADSNSALTALVTLARLHHLPADPAALRHSLGLGDTAPVTQQNLLLAARLIGLKAKVT